MERFESLTEVHQLDRLLEASRSRPVLLFKHSTVCPVSAAAWDELCRFAESSEAERVDICYVKVIEHRSVSGEIEQKMAVKHESPQAILVNRGRAVWHASHWRITEDALREAVQALGNG